MASDSTMMPMPPIQCVRLRQKSRPCGTASMSVRMEAPVVVKPDMVSKKASVKLGIAPESMKGSEPKREKSSQAKVTMAKPSRARSSCVMRVERIISRAGQRRDARAQQDRLPVDSRRNRTTTAAPSA